MAGFQGRQSADVMRIFQCPGCYVSAYPATIWEEMSPEARERSGGRLAMGDFCSRCKRYPHLREPEPGAEFEEPKCTDCGRSMISRAHHRRASDLERAELAEEGYVVAPRASSTQCIRCSKGKVAEHV